MSVIILSLSLSLSFYVIVVASDNSKIVIKDFFQFIGAAKWFINERYVDTKNDYEALFDVFIMQH